VVRDLKNESNPEVANVDDEARKEALAILGLGDNSSKDGGQAPKDEPINEQEIDTAESLDEEDEAIKKLLQSESSTEEGVLFSKKVTQPKKVKLKTKDDSAEPKKIAIKPKAKIVLGSKPKIKKEVKVTPKKPKIVIKKK
jgi:hypothetical protein